MPRGKLIIFEGEEKSGKSTQLERLAGYLLGAGYDIVATKEPGGGMQDLRTKILELDPKSTNLAQEELALFEKDRELHYSEKILPALEVGKIILCDRGPASSIAYQGYGRGMDLKAIGEANKRATKGTKADLTILMDISLIDTLQRIRNDNKTKITRFEKEPLEFHERVRQGFLAQAKKDPERWLVLDGRKSKNELALEIQEAVRKRLGL